MVQINICLLSFYKEIPIYFKTQGIKNIKEIKPRLGIYNPLYPIPYKGTPNPIVKVQLKHIMYIKIYFRIEMFPLFSKFGFW